MLLRCFFLSLFILVSVCNLRAESLSEEEESKLNSLCDSINRSDPALLAAKSKNEIEEARIGLVREALSYSELRDSCFPLISKEVVSGLDFSEKLHLLILGQLSWMIYVFIILSLLSPFLAYIGFMYFFRQDANGGGFAPAKIDLGVDEYTSLLEFFSLDDTAGEADIKRAYREMARQHHPDTADDASREEFNLLQTNYDKLMKLRKGWFGLAR